MSERDPLLEYIEAHPDASPEEVFAAFGVPFDRDLWNATLEQMPAAVAQMLTSPNPGDREHWGFRRDD